MERAVNESQNETGQLTSPQVQVSEASPADSYDIREVLEQAFQGLEERGYPSAAIEAAIIDVASIRLRLLSGHIVLVARVNDSIVGTVTGIQEHMSMHLKSFAVRPAFQRNGIGTLLVNTLESMASKRGCRKVFLFTAWPMIEAARLYLKLGYRLEGYLPNHFYGEDFAIFGKSMVEADESQHDC
ncbi:MAG: GNAT family N-acetyltransferase [Candidatus Thorarchaeota archaeon]